MQCRAGSAVRGGYALAMNEQAMRRDYAAVAAKVSSHGSREERMQRVVDALWDELSDKRVSWLGFYLKNPGGDDMVLATRRDKPACSPIGLHGACGRAWKSRRPLVVTDVEKLGAGYVACDPRDRSEVVIPMMESDGVTCWGVFDADSHETGAFGETDVAGLLRVFEAAGLTAGRRQATEVV